jgi:hypothetical protein
MVERRKTPFSVRLRPRAVGIEQAHRRVEIDLARIGKWRDAAAGRTGHGPKRDNQG